ncbi:probable plastid-lipid-associated protein 9, chloroplastic [Humulus lupulus]|uniref:probable plastid-lipid-associated protein 9, chloroplastic n=1 Tax=Humulus lupulus TaxID=3486 RepID=UPI002B4011CA|nr:probable plastid-lipid-associated protein 9, chloroplastic [Humulus lupulus]
MERLSTKESLLLAIETKFTLSTKLTVEGPLRMREEYAGGVFETPKVIEETVPEQLKGALGQAANTIQRLPVPVRDAFTGGLRVPLSGTFQRLFMISYLDDEILCEFPRLDYVLFVKGSGPHVIDYGYVDGKPPKEVVVRGAQLKCDVKDMALVTLNMAWTSSNLI